MTQHIISDEYLELLLDPEIPQDAKQIVVNEVRRTQVTPSCNSIRAQLRQLRRLYQWIQNTDGTNAPLDYDTWKFHKIAFILLENKLEQYAKELIPTLSVEKYRKEFRDYPLQEYDEKFFTYYGVI